MSAPAIEPPVSKPANPSPPPSSEFLAVVAVAAAHPHRYRRRLRRGLMATGALVGVYLSLALIVLPTCWKLRYRNVGLEDSPRITWAASGHPGDPLNVALVGTKEEIIYLFLSAGWHPADRLTWGSSMRMAKATLFHKPYPDAPVSNLFLREGKSRRKQDLAFELCEYDSPRQRHHVRFWQTQKVEQDDGRFMWIGAATYDRTAKFNKLTLFPTHGIDGNVDLERDRVFHDLEATGQLMEVRRVTGFQAVCEGVNGGGDRWFTDGDLAVGVIWPDNASIE
jgi:hypothetical protein